MDFPIRINKYLAHTGQATRLEADRLIAAGKVHINGVPAILGQKVNEGDTVTLNAPKRTYQYIAFNKPRGVITHSPEAHETDIVTYLKKEHGLTGVFPVGRLDKDSEGLMLITDDGRITDRLLNPDTNHEKEYEVEVDKRITRQFLTGMAKGVRIERYTTRPATITELGSDRFSIVLTEGKKHQIRRMCAALGFQVVKLRRVRIMNVTLNNLKSGAIRVLGTRERTELLKSLGL